MFYKIKLPLIKNKIDVIILDDYEEAAYSAALEFQGGNLQMKKLIALALCLMTMALLLCGCNSESDDDPGAIIPVYLSTEVYNFDPATAYLDDATVKLFGMLYEGLFKINSKGKVENAMAESVKVLDNPDENYYAIEITLKSTCWSDGTLVQASDYVYAFKRILDSSFQSEAASMLYDIKNARKVKSGDMSPDDLGMTDESTNVIRFEFETKIDYDQFYEYLASPHLVPLRQDRVETEPNDWASNVSIIVTNGPFVIRTINVGRSLVLERNGYYYRNVDKDSVSKYVEPYRLVINYGRTEAENFESAINGEYAIDSEIDVDSRQKYKDSKDVKTQEMLTELSYVMNTNDKLLSNADVRKALSLAIDRQKIVDEILVYASPAEGLITGNVFEAGYANKTKFREAGEQLISSGAKLDEAKSLLSNAGVRGGDITITIRKNRPVEKAVAIAVSEMWDQLGFSIKIEEISCSQYTSDKEYALISDDFSKKYYSGDFQVIGIDYQMLTTDAFPTLASFANDFSGGVVDFTSENFEVSPHVSGYSSAEYNELINKAFEQKDRKERASILHEAEKLLINDAPIIPVAVYENAYVMSKDLTKTTIDYFGCINLRKAKLADRDKYLETVPLVTEFYEAS